MVIDLDAVSVFTEGDRVFHQKFGYGTVDGDRGRQARRRLRQGRGQEDRRPLRGRRRTGRRHSVLERNRIRLKQSDPRISLRTIESRSKSSFQIDSIRNVLDLGGPVCRMCLGGLRPRNRRCAGCKEQAISRNGVGPFGRTERAVLIHAQPAGSKGEARRAVPLLPLGRAPVDVSNCSGVGGCRHREAMTSTLGAPARGTARPSVASDGQRQQRAQRRRTRFHARGNKKAAAPGGGGCRRSRRLAQGGGRAARVRRAGAQGVRGPDMGCGDAREEVGAAAGYDRPREEVGPFASAWGAPAARPGQEGAAASGRRKMPPLVTIGPGRR